MSRLTLQEALEHSLAPGKDAAEDRAWGATELGVHEGPETVQRLRVMLHDDDYVVYMSVVEALQNKPGGLELVLVGALEEMPAGSWLWLETAMSESLSSGIDVRRRLAQDRAGADPSRRALAEELWDRLWLDLAAAAVPGGRGKGPTPDDIRPEWAFEDWLRLSRVFLPVHAAAAPAGLAGLPEERAVRRLQQMALGLNVNTVEPACEALLASGDAGVDFVLRLCYECCDLDLRDGITLPLQWAVPGDLRSVLSDRRDRAPDPVVRASAAHALERFERAMLPLPGEPPRETWSVRRGGDPLASEPEEIP